MELRKLDYIIFTKDLDVERLFRNECYPDYTSRISKLNLSTTIKFRMHDSHYVLSYSELCSIWNEKDTTDYSLIDTPEFEISKSLKDLPLIILVLSLSRKPRPSFDTKDVIRNYRFSWYQFVDELVKHIFLRHTVEKFHSIWN